MGYHEAAVVKQDDCPSDVMSGIPATNAVTLEIVPAVVMGEGFDKLMPKPDVHKYLHLYSTSDATYVVLYINKQLPVHGPRVGFRRQTINPGVIAFDANPPDETNSMTVEQIVEYITARLDDPSLIDIIPKHRASIGYGPR